MPRGGWEGGVRRGRKEGVLISLEHRPVYLRECNDDVATRVPNEVVGRCKQSRVWEKPSRTHVRNDSAAARRTRAVKYIENRREEDEMNRGDGDATRNWFSLFRWNLTTTTTMTTGRHLCGEREFGTRILENDFKPRSRLRDC